jgi:hypothetical protein
VAQPTLDRGELAVDRVDHRERDVDRSLAPAGSSSRSTTSRPLAHGNRSSTPDTRTRLRKTLVDEPPLRPPLTGRQAHPPQLRWALYVTESRTPAPDVFASVSQVERQTTGMDDQRS